MRKLFFHGYLVFYFFFKIRKILSLFLRGRIVYIKSLKSVILKVLFLPIFDEKEGYKPNKPYEADSKYLCIKKNFNLNLLDK